MSYERFTLSMRLLAARLDTLGRRAATPEGRQAIVARLEAAIRRSHIGGALLDKLRVMVAYFRDPDEPMAPKLLIGGALLYLIIPTDLIPDWLPVVGFVDDFTAISYVWNRLQDIFVEYEKRRNERLVGEEA
jgi:uncharacterized membrane protein YkvA (DUF1232 family)